MKNKSNFIKVVGLGIFTILTIAFLNFNSASANTHHPEPESYEIDTAFGFDKSKGIVKNFYDKDNFIITESTDGINNKINYYEEDTKNCMSYGMKGSADIFFLFNPEKIYSDGIKWSLLKSDETVIEGIKLDHEVGKGTVLVLKKEDISNSEWKMVGSPLYDILNGKNHKIMTINESEAQNGAYFKVVIAYSVEGKYNGNKIKKNRIEEYFFYLTSESNWVFLKDITDPLGKNLEQKDEVDQGFVIYKNGSLANISKKYNDGDETPLFFGDANGNVSICDPGKWTIIIKTPSGIRYEYNIEVKYGCSKVELTPNIYRPNSEKYIYSTSDKVGRTVFETSLTTAYVIQQGEGLKKKITENGETIIGVNGDAVGIYIQLNKNWNNLGNGWSVISDSYGIQNTDYIDGVRTGEVKTGAIIVKKSADNGNTWRNCTFYGTTYENGFYSTDFAYHYPIKRMVPVYIPKGKQESGITEDDLINGVHIKLCFYYKVRYGNSDKSYTFIEEYPFYLCNNNVGAVTFKNLTEKEIKDLVIGTDKVQYDLDFYEKTSSIASGDMTVTGFTIDKSLNPKAMVTVFKDGKQITDRFASKEYRENGKYLIRVTSEYGDTRETTIYVDTSTPEKSIENYFNNCTYTMKRVYEINSDIPVFQSEVSVFKSLEIKESMQAIKGKVFKDGKEISKMAFGPTRNSVELKFNECGSYELEIRTCNDAGETVSGDVRIYRFRFFIVDKGNPPSINKLKLDEYAKSYLQDMVPIYYGVGLSSAAGGHIIVAFPDEESAQKYAGEKAMDEVEIFNDKVYYTDPNDPFGIKKPIENGWDLAESSAENARNKIKELYIDTSKDTFYPVIIVDKKEYEDMESITALQFANTVLIPNEETESLLYVTELGALPLINDKTKYIQPVGKYAKTKVYYDGFKFEMNDGESESIIVRDRYGNEYPLKYYQKAGYQLDQLGCASGRIWIMERNRSLDGKWDGDLAGYPALYIAPNDNQCEVGLRLYSDFGYTDLKVNKSSMSDTPIKVRRFDISSFIDHIGDNYSLILIYKDGEVKEASLVDSNLKISFDDKGIYSIKCVNRAGYSFTFDVEIDNSENGNLYDAIRNIMNEIGRFIECISKQKD